MHTRKGYNVPITTDRPVFTIDDVFPAFRPADIDPRLITILQLCAEVGLPFPVEHNAPYAEWWHSLHEVGHWAVKPQWYINYSAYLIEDIRISRGSLFIPAGTIPGVGEVDLPELSLYQAGNDVIPEIGLYRDPTPAEFECRVWSLQVIELMGWSHPFDDNTTGVFVGDQHLHKPASARIWAPPQLHDPVITGNMDRWGINPLAGRFRAWEAPGNGQFTLPHPRPTCHAQIMANIQQVHDQLGTAETFVTAGEARYWRTYLSRRWPDATLAHWAAERH
jgi:hypothetical protein